MKIEKKDIPKIFLLIGIFIIALGFFFYFNKKEEPKKKVDWKNNEQHQENIEEESPEIPVDVLDPVDEVLEAE